MKKHVTAWSLAAAATALLISAGPAQAMDTCKLIQGMCPDPVDVPSTHASVPEPATLALLTSGFAAAGFAAWRRRKNKD